MAITGIQQLGYDTDLIPWHKCYNKLNPFFPAQCSYTSVFMLRSLFPSQISSGGNRIVEFLNSFTIRGVMSCENTTY